MGTEPEHRGFEKASACSFFGSSVIFMAIFIKGSVAAVRLRRQTAAGIGLLRALLGDGIFFVWAKQ